MQDDIIFLYFIWFCHFCFRCLFFGSLDLVSFLAHLTLALRPVFLRNTRKPEKHNFLGPAFRYFDSLCLRWGEGVFLNKLFSMPMQMNQGHPLRSAML